MDCQQARERLDVIHPERPEQADPDVQEAVAHVKQCANCTDVIESRRTFDREIGRVLREVAVPPGLRSRLVRGVAEVASSEPGPQPAPPQRATAPNRRRRWITAFTTSAVGLLLVLGCWVLLRPSDPPPLALDVVRDWCPVNLGPPGAISALPALARGLNPALADGRWAAQAGSAAPRGADMDDDGIQDGAVYPLRGGAFLVVMGPRRVDSPPPARTVYYSPMAHAVWTVGEQVYLVFDPGGPDKLKALLDRVYGPVG